MKMNQQTIYRSHVIRTCDGCHTFTVDNCTTVFRFCCDAMGYIDKLVKEGK